MKEIEELFKSDFTLRISSDINGYDCEVRDVNLQTLPADHQEESVAFKIKEFGDKHYKQPKYNNKKDKDAIAFKSGMIRTGMYDTIILGNDRYTTQIIKSVGPLAAVGMYKKTDYDDAFSHYNYESKGSVIVDKDLNVVYSNDYDRYNTLYRTSDAYKIFHDFGPCALAFVSPEGFDATAQKDFKKLFEARMQEHAQLLTDPAKVAEEKAQFEKAFEILQKEYDKIQEKNGSSMGE